MFGDLPLLLPTPRESDFLPFHIPSLHHHKFIQQVLLMELLINSCKESIKIVLSRKEHV